MSVMRGWPDSLRMHCPLPSLTQIHVKAAGNSPRDDVGADREPKGVIADNRYLDEHADDRQATPVRARAQTQSSLHILLALRRNAKNRAAVPRTSNFLPVSRLSRFCEETRPTRAKRSDRPALT